MKNPFLQSIKLKVIIKSDKMQVIDTKDVASIHGTFTMDHKFEADTFTKLYNDKPFLNVFRITSDTACKIFMYIAYNLNRNTDIIKISTEEVMIFVGIKSLATYYKYIQEMIDNAIIARKSNSEYWVNPLFLFNGDRIAFYEEYCPECITEVRISEVQSVRVRKKKDLMKLYECKSYYQLKKKLGVEKIKEMIEK